MCVHLVHWGCSWPRHGAEHWGAGVRKTLCPQAAHSHWGADRGWVSMTMCWSMNHCALFALPSTCDHSSVVFTLTLGNSVERVRTSPWAFFLFFDLQHRLLRSQRQAWGKQVINFMPMQNFERVLYLTCGGRGAGRHAFRGGEKGPCGAGGVRWGSDLGVPVKDSGGHTGFSVFLQSKTLLSCEKYLLPSFPWLGVILYPPQNKRTNTQKVLRARTPWEAMDDVEEEASVGLGQEWAGGKPTMWDSETDFYVDGCWAMTEGNGAKRGQQGGASLWVVWHLNPCPSGQGQQGVTLITQAEWRWMWDLGT